MKFKHFVLTRYNLGIYDRKQKLRDKKRIVPEEWMENRWKLFTKFCVPSVSNQKCKDFVWIIVFDPKTPVGVLDEAEKVVPPNTIVCTGDNFRKKSIEVVESLLTDEDRVITSRIDNDDAIHQDFVGNIQEWFKIRKRTGVLTYSKGWVWDWLSNKLYHLRYIKNHFITFIEKRGAKPVKTVLRDRHTDLTSRFQTFRVETESHMWLESVHEDNLLNYARGDKVAMSKLKKQEYGLT